MSNYTNFHEIMFIYAAKNFVKHKQLVQTAVFNAPTYVLCKPSVVERSYRSANRLIF
jgi:hypothetical protein